MTETSDPQLQLKKRARRRLVGAIAFAGLAAIVLPIVMDQEPRQQPQEVQIRIPGQEQPPFQPRLAARDAPPATATDKPAVAAEKAPPAAAEPTPKEAAEPPARTGESRLAKPAEKAPAKTEERKTPRPVEKPPERSAEQKVAKAAEKPPEKAPAKTADKPKEKTGDKVAEKKAVDRAVAEKGSDKAPAKKTEKPPEASSEDGGSKPATDETSAAGSHPTGKSPAAPAAKPGGQQVIVIGAFANPENVKQLQSKISAAGVNTYTEVLETPDGKKTRVRAGPFPNREAAEKALDKLKAIGVSGVVAGRQ